MGVVTTMAVLKLGIKLAIGFGAVIVIANLVNWLNKKTFKSGKKGGGIYDIESSGDESVRFTK